MSNSREPQNRKVGSRFSGGGIKVVVCGQSADDIPEHWGVLSKAGFAERKTVGAVGFCRDPTTNDLLVSLPKAFLDEAALQRLQNDSAFRKGEVYRLIRLFEKVRKATPYKIEQSSTSVTNYEAVAATDPVLDSLEAALNLRRDFKRHGLYERKRPDTTQNDFAHPVNWKCTIEGAAPLIDRSGIFFPSTTHSKRARDNYNLIRLLQVGCLKDIFNLLGEQTWLGEAEGSRISAFIRLRDIPVARMRRLTEGIYDDRGRRLVRLIQSYIGMYRLAPTHRLEAERMLAFSTSFEIIWEHILRDVLGRQDPLSLSKGEWLSSAAPKRSGIAPRIDLWLDKDDSRIIVDAKDYRILSGDVLRGSPDDHYKQIIYRKLLPDNPQTLTNILAFPGYQQESLLQLRGCHRWRCIEESEVFEVTVDYEKIMAHWMQESQVDVDGEIQQILQEIAALRETFG